MVARIRTRVESIELRLKKEFRFVPHGHLEVEVLRKESYPPLFHFIYGQWREAREILLTLTTGNS